MVERRAFREPLQLHLTIRHHGGSVEHYHHFLLGFLVPLICYRNATWLKPRYRKILIRSCGPMDKIIRQLKADKLEILDKAEHRRLGEERWRIGSLLRGVAFGTGATRYMELRGHDYPVVYDFRAFAEAHKGLQQLLGGEIDAARAALQRRFVPGGLKILVIERGDSDPFYLSDAAEARNAGTVRRSIPNHGQVIEEMSRRFGRLLSTKLEGLSLAEQISLFSSADVIVAQHGAALSNLIWARPETCVVEIVPRTLSKETQDVAFFSNLARCMRLNYRHVWQEHEHAAVSPAAVCEAIEHAIASRQWTQLAEAECEEYIGEQRVGDRWAR